MLTAANKNQRYNSHPSKLMSLLPFTYSGKKKGKSLKIIDLLISLDFVIFTLQCAVDCVALKSSMTYLFEINGEKSSDYHKLALHVHGLALAIKLPDNSDGTCQNEKLKNMRTSQNSLRLHFRQIRHHIN